jgi:hypothetical protein
MLREYAPEMLGTNPAPNSLTAAPLTLERCAALSDQMRMLEGKLLVRLHQAARESPRIVCRKSDSAVVLDGKEVASGLTDEQFAYAEVLTINYPNPIPFPSMKRQSIYLESSNQTRLKDSLPGKLNNLIDRIPNKGHVWNLPPR